MTFNERLEKEVEELYKKVFEHAFELGQEYHNEINIPQDPCNAEDKAKAITAIKQAMREALPERANNNRYFESPPPARVDDGSELHHVMHQPSARDGYNTAIDEIEKGFGL